MAGHGYFGNIDPAFPRILCATKFLVTQIVKKIIS